MSSSKLGMGSKLGTSGEQGMSRSKQGTGHCKVGTSCKLGFAKWGDNFQVYQQEFGQIGCKGGFSLCLQMNR